VTLKTAHRRYIALIDIRVNYVLKNGGLDDDIYELIKQNYKMYLSVKTKATKEEFELLCETYKGFCYFGQLVDLSKTKRGIGALWKKDFSLSSSLGS